MSSPSLRTGTRGLRNSMRLAPQLRTNANTNTAPRALNSLTGKTQSRGISQAVPSSRSPSSSSLLRHNQRRRIGANGAGRGGGLHSQIRGYAPSTSPTEITADNLIEELQDLYEIAKDEFEIATDSTDGSTIYAASDRESARDALNQLVAVYELYVGVRESGQSGDGASIVETNFDPAAVGEDVRGEIKKRVGQRVRELKNAVEILEERAHDE